MFSWNDECEQVFQNLKNTLTSPPILHKPNIHQPLLVYITAMDHTVSAALVQDVDGTQHSVYFVNRILQDPETRYQMVEKLALSLAHTARRLQHHRQNRLPHPKDTLEARPCRSHVVLGRRTIRVQHPL